MSRKKLVSDADVDAAFGAARRSGSPDKIIGRLLAAVDDPRQRAEDFNPAYAMVMIAELLERSDRLAEAEVILRRAAAEDIRSDSTDPRLWLAAFLVGTGQEAEAAEVFRQVRKDATDFIPYEVYGEALDEAGVTDEALKIFVSGQQHMLRLGNDEDAARLGQAADRVRADMGFPA